MTKKLLLGVTLFSSLLFSDGICKIPKDCTIISSEFSTASGGKASYVMEIDCKKPNGTITKYLDYEFSVAGIFYLGRISMPRKIKFQKWDKDELECDY
jgi:hypothetical protein